MHKLVTGYILEGEFFNCCDLSLIRKVQIVDESAAEYIMEHYATDLVDAKNLSQVFHWAGSQQGHDYWKAIHNRIEEGLCP